MHPPESISEASTRLTDDVSNRGRIGEKWTTHHRIVGLNAQSAIVTVGWIVRKDTGELTLTSCYIESNQQERLQRLFDSE